MNHINKVTSKILVQNMQRCRRDETSKSEEPRFEKNNTERRSEKRKLKDIGKRNVYSDGAREMVLAAMVK